MAQVTLEIFDHFLKYDIWLQPFEGLSRLNKVTIKASPTGYLAILSGFTAEGPVVGFVGAAGLSELRDKIRGNSKGYNIRWREDQYYFDKKP